MTAEALTPSHLLVRSIREQLEQLEAQLSISPEADTNRPLAGAVRTLVLETARTDPRVTRSALLVLEILVPELHWGALRPVKLGWLAKRARRARPVTYRHLRTLTDLGYLEGVRRSAPGACGMYRLALPTPP